ADPEKAFATDKAAAEEDASLAILRSLGFRFRAALEKATQQPADEQWRHRRYWKVDADRERQRGNLQQLADECYANADRDESPRQLLVEHAFDDELHQRRLWRRKLRAAKAERFGEQ